MNENNFTKLYKTYSTDKLMDIIDNPNDYQPLAVETASLELDSRQLSTAQLESAKTIQAERQNEKAVKQQKIRAIEERIKSVGLSMADTLNPIQNEKPSSDKYIKLISLFLNGLALYQIYKEFGLLKFLFSDSSTGWNFSMVLYFIPLIILPTAGLLLWFRKKIGWILSTLFFSYTATGTIPLFLSALNRQPTGDTVFDSLFPVVSPIVYIGTFLIFGGATWVMTKEDIRVVYNIGKRTMFVTIGLGAATILLLRFA